jgi:hypothetical protein
VCPDAFIVYNSRQTDRNKCGFGEFIWQSQVPTNYYTTISASGSLTTKSGYGEDEITYKNTWSGSQTKYMSGSGFNNCDTIGEVTIDPAYIYPAQRAESAVTATTQTLSGISGTTGSVTISLSGFYSTATFKSQTYAALPAFGGGFGQGTAFSKAYLTAYEATYRITESKYRITHSITKRMMAGECYRVKWIERTVTLPTKYGDSGPGFGSMLIGGAPISSVEVIDGGAPYATARAVASVTAGVVTAIQFIDLGNGYTAPPTITLSAPPGDGTQATAHAVVTPDIPNQVIDGELIPGYAYPPGTYSVIIDNGGSGYSTAPMVAVSAPFGAALPLITISPSQAGPSYQATCTAVLAANGSIASVTIGNPGNGYGAFQTAAYVGTSANGLGIGARFIVHYGTEVVKEYLWNGVVPQGYKDLDEKTYPFSEFLIPVPTQNQITFTDLLSIVSSCGGCT